MDSLSTTQLFGPLLVSATTNSGHAPPASHLPVESIWMLTFVGTNPAKILRAYAEQQTGRSISTRQFLNPSPCIHGPCHVQATKVFRRLHRVPIGGFGLNRTHRVCLPTLAMSLHRIIVLRWTNSQDSGENNHRWKTRGSSDMPASRIQLP